MWKTELVPQLLQRAFKPRSGLTVTQYSRRHVFLTAKQSPSNPGYYNPDLTPYLNDIMDSFVRDDFDEEHIIKSSQSGVTEAVLNILRFAIAEEPMNALFAIDSRVEAKKIADIRLIPTLQSNQRTAAQITDDRDDINSMTINLRDMVIYMLGSYSKAGFENKPVQLIILDELAKHQVSEGEESTVDLARQRFKTLIGQRRKLYTMTKPSVEDSVEWLEYTTGTREKYFCPCPHCDRYQEIVWEGFRYEHCKDLAGYYDLERVAAETYYECENEVCTGGRRIEQRHKEWMLARGAWRRTNFDVGRFAAQPRKRSRHISDLISPFAKWGELAVEFIGAGTDPGKLLSFRIGRLGLPKKAEAFSDIGADDILRLRLPYRRGTFPFKPRLVTLTIDVQGDEQKYVIGGFDGKGNFYVSDWGSTGAREELSQFVAFQSLSYGVDGEFVRPEIAFMDEGWDTDKVREFIAANDYLMPRGWYPCRGRELQQIRGIIWKVEVPTESGSAVLPAYFFHDDVVKRRLYHQRIARPSYYKLRMERDSGDQLARDLFERTPKVHFPEDVVETFYRELLSEKLVKETGPRGFLKESWEKDPSVPNDWGDACKMAPIIWEVVGEFFADAKETGGAADRVRASLAAEASVPALAA